MKNIVTVKETRANLAEILDRVEYKKEEFVITKYGQVTAIIVPPRPSQKKEGTKSKLEALRKLRDHFTKEDVKELEKNIRKYKASQKKKYEKLFD